MSAEPLPTVEAAQIAQILPHRFPFLLVDRVLAVEPGRRARGLKRVSGNEPYFPGHFPDQPIMPGVIILEVMSQVGGFVFLPTSLEALTYTRGFVIGFDRARFRRFVVPGDSLVVEAELLGRLKGLARVKAVATVDDEVAAEAEISYALE